MESYVHYPMKDKIEMVDSVINKYIDNKNSNCTKFDSYSYEEDISILEFRENSQNLRIIRNFISDVELSDLQELMVTLDDHLVYEEQFDTDNEMTGLVKCMKSLVRITTRFCNTDCDEIPVKETNQFRRGNSIW